MIERVRVTDFVNTQDYFLFIDIVEKLVFFNQLLGEKEMATFYVGERE